MSEEVNNQGKIRKYLLGILDETRVEEIEKLLVSDDKCFQELQLAEVELIQDFVDGKLSQEEKKAFDENFIITDERREEINFARVLRKFVDEKSESLTEKKPSFFDSLRSFFLSPIPALCSVLIVVGISFFVWWNYSSRQSEILVALNNSQKNVRSTESRISDLNYAPKIEGTRSGNTQTQNDELDFAELKARTLARENATAENLHELGRVYLAQKKFDAAITELEKAIKLNSNIAKLHNDLGAALMEKGNLIKSQSKENDTKDKKPNETKPYLELFAQANESFSKAIELDKSNLESKFNQALCVEALGLQSQAKEAWENYLKLDSTSKWADEAREHLKKLEENKPISKTKEQVLQEFLEAKEANDREKAWQVLSRNREMITGKLIPQQLAFLFVDSKATDDEPKAKEALDSLLYAGKLEEEKSGDLFWKDLADYYKNISDNKISIIKDAQDAIRKGYELIKEDKYKEAQKEFEKAAVTFSENSNIPEANFCKYWISYLLFQNDDIKSSNEILYEIKNLSEKKKYSWLASHIYFWLAINANSQKKISKAIQYDQKAIEYSEAVSELYNLQKGLSQIADHYQQVGQFTKALNYAQKGLILGEFPETSLRQKWRDYDAVSDIFNKMRMFKTSEMFKKETLLLAEAMSDADVFKWSSYTDLAVMYGRQSRYSEAFNLISEARKVAEKFDEENRKRNIAYIDLQTGYLYQKQNNCPKAIESYDSTLEFYKSSENVVNEFEARKGRLLCYLTNNNDDVFQKELPTILDLFNKYRTEILEEQNRNHFFDKEQNIYDIAIDYEFNKSNFENAFNYSEESRSRSLLDLQNKSIEIVKDEQQPEIQFSSNIAKPLKLTEIQSEMPDNIQLLQYTILEKKVLIWLITKNNLIIEKTEISEKLLNEKVLSYIDLVSNNGEVNEQLNLSRELYQILIAPIEEKIVAEKEIFIIPDKILFRLPFVTLYSDKYLIEDYKISYSPSANVFLFSTKKANELQKKTLEHLLSVGNPDFDSTAFENLQSLPSAKKEAQEIAQIYDNSVVFTEKQATKKTIKEAINKAEVVHFAGHYIVDENSPLLSGLVLSGNEEEDSILANYEIISQRITQPRLIILSACQTGIEKYYNGEGMIGASRIFLAIGVPLVVASQWKVDSEATSDLMINFHRYRKKDNLPTSEALRQAQIKMLRSKEHQNPYYWAAFMTLGSYAQF